MFTFLIVLTIVAAVLLILVVLAQNPKGGGLSSQFGGAGTSQLMGVKRTGDFLEKTTWVLSIAIVVFCLSSFAFMNKGGNEGGTTTPAMEKAGEQQNLMPLDNSGGDPLGTEGLDLEPEEGAGGTENLMDTGATSLPEELEE